MQARVGCLEEFEREKVYVGWKEQGLLGRLRGLIGNRKEEVQLECLECLRVLARSIVVDEEDCEQTSHLILAIAAALEQSSERILLLTL